MRMRWILPASVALLLAAGCGGGGDTTGPPPAPNDETEPNDFTAQFAGDLTGTDIVLHGTAVNAADVDMFLVTLTAPGALFAEVDWSGSADLELAISNDNGVFIRSVDTATHPETCLLSGLPDGTYTVRIGSFTNAATNYTLTLGAR